MKGNYKRILTLFAWVSITLFIVRTVISVADVIDMVSNLKIAELLYSFVGYGGEAIAVACLLLFFYDRFWWKSLNFWKIPVFAKEYEGTISSSYDNKKRKAKMIVKQTFLSIKITMKTAESCSDSVCESIEDQNGSLILTYTYLNKPDLKLYDRSKMHFGTATFRCDDLEQLKGDYYTDRKTIGTMVFKASKSKSEQV